MNVCDKSVNRQVCHFFFQKGCDTVVNEHKCHYLTFVSHYTCVKHCLGLVLAPDVVHEDMQQSGHRLRTPSHRFHGIA